MKLTDVNTRRLSVFGYKSVGHFKFLAGMIRGYARKLLCDADGPTFLKKSWWDLVWIETSRSEFMIAHVDQCPFLCFKSSLARFSNVKSITLHTLELAHLVRGFAVSEGREGIGQVGVRVSE